MAQRVETVAGGSVRAVIQARHAGDLNKNWSRENWNKRILRDVAGRLGDPLDFMSKWVEPRRFQIVFYNKKAVDWTLCQHLNLLTTLKVVFMHLENRQGQQSAMVCRPWKWTPWLGQSCFPVAQHICNTQKALVKKSKLYVWRMKQPDILWYWKETFRGYFPMCFCSFFSLSSHVFPSASMQQRESSGLDGTIRRAGKLTVQKRRGFLSIESVGNLLQRLRLPWGISEPFAHRSWKYQSSCVGIGPLVGLLCKPDSSRKES